MMDPINTTLLMQGNFQVAFEEMQKEAHEINEAHGFNETDHAARILQPPGDGEGVGLRPERGDVEHNPAVWMREAVPREVRHNPYEQGRNQ